jgi:hypothetical protein
MPWFYLSFSDGLDKWRGAAIVQAKTPMLAVSESWKLDCNPSGEVLIMECDEPGEGYKNRLLEKWEVELVFGPVSLVKTAGCEHHRKIVEVDGEKIERR